MKHLTILFGLLLSLGANAQPIGDARIDEAMADLEAPTADSLGRMIGERYATDREKARAVFSWIAQHIQYNTRIYARTNLFPRFTDEPEDTASAWPSGIEMAARKVLQRRVAVCEGYARLFKTICTYAGLESELVSGYARANGDRPGRFKTNHTWNAVRIDSTWQLVDPTWGSGYVTYSDQFISHIDAHYFLTDPRVFMRDHYPEDLRWTLLPEPPEPSEYRQSPFLASTFVKYSIDHYFPQSGILHAAVGDTLTIELRLRDPERDRNISPSPFLDSAQFLDTLHSVFLQPERLGNRVRYHYVVGPQPPQWVHLLYNDDIILRYSLQLRPRSDSASGAEAVR